MATLHHQVWIDAPVAKVYEGLATAEGLGGWWAPHTATPTEAGLVLAHSPGPEHGDVKMKVVGLVPETRISGRSSAPIRDAARPRLGRARVLCSSSRRARIRAPGWESVAEGRT